MGSDHQLAAIVDPRELIPFSNVNMRAARFFATAALLAVVSAEVDRKELATKLARLMSAPGPLGWSADGHMATANIATSVSVAMLLLWRFSPANREIFGICRGDTRSSTLICVVHNNWLSLYGWKHEVF